jgi:hypothetical protein
MATYDQTAAYYSNQREKQLRELLRRDYGARKYRIVGTGVNSAIHVYGKMPNSVETGWYLLGWRSAVETEYCL